MYIAQLYRNNRIIIIWEYDRNAQQLLLPILLPSAADDHNRIGMNKNRNNNM